MFVHPQHPNYPPTWLTRHYGPLCVGWPGVHARQYEPGQPHRLPYRMWLHSGDADVEQLKAQYAAFTAGAQSQWGGTWAREDLLADQAGPWKTLSHLVRQRHFRDSGELQLSG